MERIKITDLCYYHLEPPYNSGGQLRIYNLMKYLPGNFQTYLMVYGDILKTQRITDNFIQFIFARPRLNLFLTGIINFLAKTTISHSLVSSLLCRFDKEFIKNYKSNAKDSQLIISEFPYLFSLLSNNKDKLIIYNAHNVEYDLQKHLFSHNLFGRLIAKHIKRLEDRACKQADVIASCSLEDKKRLCSLYNISADKVFVIPNGIDTQVISPVPSEIKNNLKQKYNLSNKKIILFIGSEHQPNVEAAEYIINKLAPSLAQYKFIIAGSVVKKLKERNIKNKEFDLKYNDHNKISAYGWHNYEYWPDNLLVRWTKKHFGFHIKSDNVTEFCLKVKCRKKIMAKVYVNQHFVGDLKTSRNWQTFRYNIPKLNQPFIDIKLDRDWKPITDGRWLGIAISEIKYISEKNNHNIDLKNLKVKDYLFTKDNIDFIGDLDNDLKKDLLIISDLAINPMFHGSGTNLKMFEYMAAALPVVSTRLGARGIEADNTKHLLISEPDNFKNNIIQLLRDDQLYKNISANSRQLVENKYDWKIISNKFADVMQSVLVKRKDESN